MLDFFQKIFSSPGFMPHGHCYLWTPGIVWLHVISDALVALAYFSIAITLAWFVRQRRDIDFRWMFGCFALFILACGTTHLLEIWNVWHGNYWLSGGMKAVTAAASIPTAILLTRLMPQALRLPTPATLRQANVDLQEEVVARRAAEGTLRESNALLEIRVGERTAELQEANTELQRQIADRERTDERVRWLASISEQNPNPIAEFERVGGVLTYANPAATQLLPDLRRDGLGHPWLAEVRDLAHRWSDDHLDTVRCEAAFGETSFLLSVTFLPGTQRVRVYGSDITDRMQAEKAVRASEGRYRALFESAPDGIVIADAESYYLDANASICRMLGYTRAELIGLHARDIVVPSEIEHIGPALSAINATSEYHREWQFRRRDGSVFAAEVIATGMPDGNLLGMIRDITDRKQAEDAVHASEAHFRFLNDLSETMRTLADPAEIMAVTARMLGRHLRVSRCAYADVEPDGEQFTILHDYTDGCASTVGNYQLSHFGRRAVTTLHRGETLIIRDVQAELLPGDGAEMFNAIGIQAIITCPLVKNGGLRAMMAVHQATPRDWKPGEIAMVQDVVERCWAMIERRTAEEKIRQFNAGLEQRVIERTAQLESANKELEAFSYSVSHDLRAPLRAVDGFSQAVLEDYGPQLPEQGQRYLQTIRESARRMGLLIDDLLTFSRLSRLPLNKHEIDVGKMVRGILSDSGLQTVGRQIDLRIGELPACAGDSALLWQVWVNLISNALKYTKKREQTVVEIGATRERGATVYFVRDNGTGFDMRYAHKLFGVFQRLHRAEEYEGTGVGLAIVQRIVHRHGGRVWAEAALDRGATFYFTLEGETEL